MAGGRNETWSWTDYHRQFPKESQAKAGDEAEAGQLRQATGAIEGRPVKTVEAEPVSRPVAGRSATATAERMAETAGETAPEAGVHSAAPASGFLDFCAFGCAVKTRVTVLSRSLEGDRVRQRLQCGCPLARTWRRTSVVGGRS